MSQAVCQLSLTSSIVANAPTGQDVHPYTSYTQRSMDAGCSLRHGAWSPGGFLSGGLICDDQLDIGPDLANMNSLTLHQSTNLGMQLDRLEGGCNLPSRQQTSHLPEVILILELAVMKGALFMSGAVATTRLYSAGKLFLGTSWNILEHLGTCLLYLYILLHTVVFFNGNLVPGEHINIGSFCPVGVQPASFPKPSTNGPSAGSHCGGTSSSTCRYILALACCGDTVQSHQAGSGFHSIPNYIELQRYSLEMSGECSRHIAYMM